MFKLLRADIDLLVVSNKYLNELKAFPESELSFAHGLYRVSLLFLHCKKSPYKT